jgi:hypothetical protein
LRICTGSGTGSASRRCSRSAILWRTRTRGRARRSERSRSA